MAQTSYGGSTFDNGTDQVGRSGDKVKDTAEGVVAQVEEYASMAMDQGREAAERIQEAAGSVKSAVDTSLKNQPMATLAGAVVVGFLLGAVWKS
jgi:ElaB/YqjD/DUF883 family membrane-anchored ribosome-binding protein